MTNPKSILCCPDCGEDYYIHQTGLDEQGWMGFECSICDERFSALLWNDNTLIICPSWYAEDDSHD